MEAKTLTDQAYQQLREDIVHGRFGPGDKLGIELLKRTYGVGATPLREALYRLSSDGFVLMQDNTLEHTLPKQNTKQTFGCDHNIHSTKIMMKRHHQKESSLLLSLFCT